MINIVAIMDFEHICPLRLCDLLFLVIFNGGIENIELLRYSLMFQGVALIYPCLVSLCSPQLPYLSLLQLTSVYTHLIAMWRIA